MQSTGHKPFTDFSSFQIFLSIWGARVPPSGICVKLIIVVPRLHPIRLACAGVSRGRLPVPVHTCWLRISGTGAAVRCLLKAPYVISMSCPGLNTHIVVSMKATMDNLDTWFHFIYFLLKIAGFFWRNKTGDLRWIWWLVVCFHKVLMS